MIFVTGATGLLGGFICRELLRNGQRIKAVKRESSQLTLIEDIADQIEWVHGDMDDTTFLLEALEGVSAVVHGAAIISFDKRDEEQMYKTNVRGTADLVNACIKKGVTNFLHISSVAALGRKPDQIQIDENDKWEGTEYDSIYSRSKYLQELEVWRGAQEGLKVKIVNPSVVLGPGLWGSGSTAVFKFAHDAKRFHPEGTINFVDVRDVAEVCVKLLNSEIDGERFVLSADSMDFKNFLTLAANRFGKQPPKQPVPYWLLKIAVKLEFIRSRIMGQSALITRDTAKLSRMKYHFNNTKVKKALNFEFRTLEETLDWSISELKKMHAL
ncbi:MAG: epimerase [Cytophagales bacterium CG12_big_fil_rev_8_21_14_0_65_40_12]|nr:MAG: epimerase [Cytophagales bacterium CG12_big_fil_rev_8_21_14_0_65_40_12]PIW05358.1 MAG: epimerase [Cytophagales bacterium CG17_big_fil_post_rev_8_21_14_2_50_40_13]